MGYNRITTAFLGYMFAIHAVLESKLHTETSLTSDISATLLNVQNTLNTGKVFKAIY